MKSTCDLCQKELSTEASLKQHREKYCRYREGKKAKSSVVDCRRGVVNIDDGEIEFRGENDVSYITRTRVSVNGRARQYEMVPREV